MAMVVEMIKVYHVHGSKNNVLDHRNARWSAEMYGKFIFKKATHMSSLSNLDAMSL